MKKRFLIVLGILFTVIGIYFLVQYNIGNSKVTSKMNKKLESEWNSLKSVSRIGDSNEKISFKKIDIIVVLNEKIIGDTASGNPLIIDLNKDEIITKTGLFSKSWNVNLAKNIHQKFNVETDLTTVKIDINGEIKYNVNYEVEGVFNYKKSEEIVTNLIMEDIYNNVKESIKDGIPEIKINKIQAKTESKLDSKTLIKL